MSSKDILCGASGVEKIRAFSFENLGHSVLYQLDCVPIFAAPTKFARAEGSDAVIRLRSQLLNMHDFEEFDWCWSNFI